MDKVEKGSKRERESKPLQVPIPSALHKRAKLMALKRGISLRDLVITALRHEVKSPRREKV